MSDAQPSERAPGGESAVALLRPLRHPQFRWLWSGMTVSLLGDGIFLVAMSWQVYELSNTPTALSLVALSVSIPQVVLFLIGGVISDRLDRRRIMLTSDIVRGVTLAVVAILAIAGQLEIWHMMCLLAVYGAGAAFFGPAFDSIVPQMVPRHHLTEANALDQFVRPAALMLAGPAIGGFLTAGAGAGWALLLDAGTFAVSAFCISRIPGGFRGHAASSGSAASAITVREVVRDLWEGFQFIRQRVWLWGTFLSATATYMLFMGPVEVLLPYIVKNEMGMGAGALGLVFAAGGIGAVCSAVIIGQRGMPRRNMTFIYVCWAVGTLMIAGYGLAVSSWQLMVACLAFNALETAGLIVWVTTKQRYVPGHLLGRVSSFDWFISIGLVPISIALTAPIAAWVGAQTTLVAAGVIGAAVTMTFYLLPGMRKIENREQPDQAQSNRSPVLDRV